MREVEVRLREWREIKYQLHVKYDDAIFGGYGTDFEARARGGRPGNPTQSRALRSATDPETRLLKRLDDALEGACLSLGGPLGKQSREWYAMRMRYLGNNPWERIAKRFGVSRQTVWRWDKQFKRCVWEQLRGAA